MAQEKAIKRTLSAPTEGLSKRKSSDVHVKGLFRRGQVFWWNHQENGHRLRISLETTDHGEAIRKVLEYRARPHLTDAGRWEFEVEQYLSDQTRRGRLSSSYASSRRYVLLSFAKDCDIQSPRDVTTVMVQRWYDGLKGGGCRNSQTLHCAFAGLPVLPRRPTQAP